MTDHHFQLQPASSIPLELINDALFDVCPEAATVDAGSAPPERQTQPWPPSCQRILEAYVKEHFSKITHKSPESKIVNRPAVKKTGGKIIELRGRKLKTDDPWKTYLFAKDKAAIFIMIKLAEIGSLKVKLKTPDGAFADITWEQGSLLYMTANCVLYCSGDGQIVCMLLICSYGDEQEQASTSRA